MPITVQHQKEALGQAYIRAVIAQAGFTLAMTDFDYGIDGTIKDVQNFDGRYAETGFGINFQLKSSVTASFESGGLIYDLESKNYNDLVRAETMLPSILILFVMPTEQDSWVTINSEQLIVKKCAWWCSLEGQEPTQNAATKRISIPECQIFSPETLTDLMRTVRRGQRL